MLTVIIIIIKIESIHFENIVPSVRNLLRGLKWLLHHLATIVYHTSSIDTHDEKRKAEVWKGELSFAVGVLQVS